MREIASIEKILEDMEALKKDIEERIEAIENGNYWDDPEAWDNDYDYDEDPDFISDDQIDELASFFGEAGDHDEQGLYIKCLLMAGRLNDAFVIKKGQKKRRTAKRDEYIAWAERIGKSRINHIVSNKHRNAYARAAQVLGSLAETYKVMARDDKVNRLLHHFYNEKYNRFSAFRREVKTVVRASDLLKNLDF
jgi:hypothetical protein